MKTKNSLALFSLFVFLAGCASLQTGGEVQWGRQALLEGKNEAALGYFYSAAQRDPNYVYATGSSPEARRLELCRTVRVPYRQNSPSPAKLGAGACRQSSKKISPGSIWV